MRYLVTYILLILTSIDAVAKVEVQGIVVDDKNNEPLAGASIIIRGTDNTIKEYTISDKDGKFQIAASSVEGCRLEVSMMGFEKKFIPLDNVYFPITITMTYSFVQLKEVTIKSERIREQGDTISYNVRSFAQPQDRSISDVLKRLPGIEVSNSGKIQYQGEDINKFYIEGSDLLGGKYGVATNGISHDDVRAVEVMENHQPMQVLSGISFSDKAAINLKLRNKVTWSLHGNAGGGWLLQPAGAVWDGELFAMAAMPGFQNITTLRTNNSGIDISASSTDFFANRRGTGLSRYVGVGLPEVPSLDSKRTFFNRSFLISTNNRWKLGLGEFKANIDYSFNRVTANASNITTYFLNEGNRIITENRDVYELNQKSVFINNTLQTDIDWNDISLHTAGSIPNSQSADLPDYYINNQFKMIKRFKGNSLVTFESCNEWESLPQTLKLDVNGNTYRQHVSDHAFYTQESAAYAFSLKGINISLEGGLKGYRRSMNSEPSLNMDNLLGQLSGIYENVIHTNSFSVYVMPKLEYWIKHINLTLNLPTNYAHYSFDKVIADHDEVYFSPSLSFNWKPNNRFSGTIRGGIGQSPMNLNLIHPELIMTDYRTLKSGIDNFYNSSFQNVSAGFNYKHIRHGLFANGMVMHSWSHLPYTLAQQLYGDYVVYSYADAPNDEKTIMVMGSLGKTLNFMRGSCNINSSFNRNESRLLSQQQSIQSIGSYWKVGAKINGSPCRWFNFDYAIGYSKSRLTMNEVSAPWLSAMTNEMSLNFTPHSKWLWQVSGEHYRNELTEGTFKNIVMLDTKLIFMAAKRIELSASLTNILNKKQYDYITYSQLASFESQRQLRGRQFLISISIRK